MDEFLKYWPLAALVLTAFASFVWFTVVRLINHVDELDKAVHGPDGPVALNRGQLEAMKINYLLRADFNTEMDRVSSAIDRMRLEGIARETRILDSVERINTNNKDESRQIREDISGVHQRIDRLVSARREPD